MSKKSGLPRHVWYLDGDGRVYPDVESFVAAGAIKLPRRATSTLEPSRTVHPTWCLGDPVGCDYHRGEAAVIPATGGRHHNDCDGVAYPAFQVGAATTSDGGPGVFMSPLTPGAYEPIMRPAEVRTLVANLTAALAEAEGGAA